MKWQAVALLFAIIGAALYVGGLAAAGTVSTAGSLGLVLFVALIGGVVMAPSIVLALE